MQIMSRLRKIKAKVTRYYKEKIKKDNFSINIYKWKDINGDDTLRLDYPLDENSVVFDVGGYLGDFTTKIHCRYNCNLIVFEPVKEYYAKIIDRFKNNKKIRIFNFGLADHTYDDYISVDNFNSSLFRKSFKNNSSEQVQLVSINDFMKDKGFHHINLIKINIEGGEYDLLNSIIDQETIKEISYLQIQFHSFVPNAQEKRRIIQKKLQKTHTLMWEYPFVWESWKRK